MWHVVEAVGKLSGGHAEQIDGQLQMIGAWSDPLPGRNGLFVLTAPFGALVLCVLFRAARNTGHGRQAAVLLLTTLGFVLTQSFNIVVAQRYFEPVILSVVLVLGAMATAAELRTDGVHRRWPRFAGPLTLAAVQLCLTAATTYREAFVP